MKLAVVRIRGRTAVKGTIARTLALLNLHKRNHCVIVESKPEVMGMLEKVKHFVTWGVVGENTLELLKKRGPGPVYCLNPPRKGYGRKGIKLPFSLGGAYGDRKEKICDLIQRMV